MSGELRVVADAEAVAAEAEQEFVRAAEAALAARGRFTVALSGGHTPRRLYERLAERPLEWSRVFFFWGDERAVPPEDPESNYRMARLTLLDRIGARPEQIFPIPAELPPAQAADAYQATLRAFFQLGPGQWPVLDLVLLGLGADGHTASLFPGTAALEEQQRLVVAHYVEAVGGWRITLTLPVLNAARAVIFLVSGAHKAWALRAALEPDRTTPPVPAARVAPTHGRLLWLVDQAAAQQLAGTEVTPWPRQPD